MFQKHKIYQKLFHKSTSLVLKYLDIFILSKQKGDAKIGQFHGNNPSIHDFIHL